MKKKAIIIALFFLSGWTLSYSQKLIPYRSFARWGYSDSNKNLIIQPKFEGALFFNCGLARVVVGNIFAFIDTSGDIKFFVNETDFDFAFGFSNDSLALASIGSSTNKLWGVPFGGKWGLINIQGEVVCGPKYDQIGNVSENLRSVNLGAKLNNMGFYDGGKWGFINNKGKEIIPLIYEEVGNFNEGLARVNYNGLWGFIDKTNKKVITFNYDDVGDFNNGYARARFNGKWGLINKKGNAIIDFQYEDIGNFSEELVVIKINKNYGYVNKSGKIIIQPQYDLCKDFKEGLACVVLKNKYGFIDKSGKVIISLNYDYADDFYNGIAIVCIGKIEYSYDLGKIKDERKFGAINRYGEIVIPIKFDFVNSFESNDNYTFVTLNGRSFVINRDGIEFQD